MNRIFTRQRLLGLVLLLLPLRGLSEDGYDLWLRYSKIPEPALLNKYLNAVEPVFVAGNSKTIHVIKDELSTGLSGLLGKRISCNNSSMKTASLILFVAGPQEYLKYFSEANNLGAIAEEGFIIFTKIIDGKSKIVVSATTDIGLLYGMFRLLQLMQTNQPLERLNISSTPRISLRMLNHWDNLNRTVERGYAGFSLWNWHTLPDYIDQRYIDYARANASIGINGTVLTNVNANATVLSKTYLQKVRALANTFRPYGIKVYLTARFSAPIELGGLKTADPLNDTVRQWWKDKAKEIYELIPDFGGFLVKANSEGQPGPQNYGRGHAEGANMMADAVAPYKGIIIWRAFVYSQQSKDRFKQAYEEFKPLDGKFNSNVLIQVKNGPIDFQPREPFSPLFGSMKTPIMMEFQLTQEYMGQGTHLVYETPMFKEVLDADTYKNGKGTEVVKTLSGMAGVSNIGNDRNWTGHLFGQANWYALGRLAWDPSLSSEQIAEEWIKLTFTNNPSFLATTKKIMLGSHETMVNYMTPLGLHHIMGNGHHYGPAPWSDNLPRPDWNPVYYHKADAVGIGFDRTVKGTDALSQYAPEVRKKYEDIKTCDENYLLWFHHVGWDHRMRSGRNLWEELCHRYYKGVDEIRSVQKHWATLEKFVDKERFQHVKMLLLIQLKEAIWWRNACLLYFQTFSKMPLPAGFEKPDQTLEYYMSLRFPYAPGN